MHPLTLLRSHDHIADGPDTVALGNDADPRLLTLTGLKRIDLHFPKFTDGRAFTQAYVLRRRMDFRGEIRATGDVLVDQLVQMQRTGFSSAVLRADQSLEAAHAQFDRYPDFYQGDAVNPQPLFGKAVSA
jgi:uncharacterized protein (DUF934 family)